MNYTILQGNIIDAKVDAVVLPANTKLREGSGTSKAIFEAAGRKDLTKVCKKIGYCEVGSAVPTYGFKLGCERIIHTVVPKWIDGNQGEYDLLCSAYYSALKMADVMKLKSMAFPLLASGNNGFDQEIALEIALKSIESFQPEVLEEVIVVLYGNKITGMVKEKGYDVGILPRNIEKDKSDFLKKLRKEKIIDDAKKSQKIK